MEAAFGEKKKKREREKEKKKKPGPRIDSIVGRQFLCMKRREVSI